jgi:hypothetical protein
VASGHIHSHSIIFPRGNSCQWPYIWLLTNFTARQKLPVAIYMATHNFSDYIWPLALMILPCVITDGQLVSIPTVIERGTGAESPYIYIYLFMATGYICGTAKLRATIYTAIADLTLARFITDCHSLSKTGVATYMDHSHF